VCRPTANICYNIMHMRIHTVFLCQIPLSNFLCLISVDSTFKFGWHHKFEGRGGAFQCTFQCIWSWGGGNTVKTLTFEEGGGALPPSPPLQWWRRLCQWVLFCRWAMHVSVARFIKIYSLSVNRPQQPILTSETSHKLFCLLKYATINSHDDRISHSRMSLERISSLFRFRPTH